MRSWDRVAAGTSLRSGSAALAVLLLGLFISLAPVSQRLENAVYDTVQRLSHRDASGDVVLIDTSTLRGEAGSAWDSSAFPDLLEALGQSRARLVIPTEAPPLAAALPDARQLAALADLERRNAAGQANAANTGPGGKWAEIRGRSELQSRTIEAARQLRNLIIGIPAFDSTAAIGVSTSGCRKHFLAGSSPSQDDDSGARRVRSVSAPPQELCEAALGAGHIGIWSEPDGTVRRLDLLINAAGNLVPSVALKGKFALSFPSDNAIAVGPGSISWDDHRIRTSGGAAALLRFYHSPEGPGQEGSGGLTTLSAEDLLRPGPAQNLVAGRVAVLGDATVKDGQGYQTPVADNVAPAVLLATGLTNLLAGDYIVRAAWFAWLETGLLFLLGLLVVLWGRRLPTTLALMTALCLVTALVGTEVYLLSIGVWVQLATAAAFVLFALLAVRLVPLRLPASSAQPRPAPPPRTHRPETSAGDELDLAFSMLRQQPATEHVKQRLYDIALEHARQRDLAKAERVLRHLTTLDPDYRNAGVKLKKLAGMRVAASRAPPRADPASPPARPEIARAGVHGDDLSGQTIGRYEIEHVVGRGAMATVYLGRDPKINRRVAVKTIALAEEFGDDDLDNARTQFLREAESAGRLNHPNIISIYDAGEDGRYAYLAMEYCTGKPMSFYAQQGQLLPAKKVVEITALAAEALHYAHQQHVVHRDVKPANLLYDAASDTLKITDFGIARLTDTSRTKTGIILGTPSYMSPEQLAGTGVNGQSDLFSLGITLYQLLTGSPPFRADSIPKLMQKIAHEPHPPVSSCRDDLPATLDAIIDRALAKDPIKRFANGREMALALRDCCSSFESNSTRKTA